MALVRSTIPIENLTINDANIFAEMILEEPTGCVDLVSLRAPLSYWYNKSAQQLVCRYFSNDTITVHEGMIDKEAIANAVLFSWNKAIKS